MRAVLLILILVVVAAIIAIATGFLDISQTRPARAPDIDATGSGISAEGGQAPAFDVDAGTVSIGAQPQNVTVPMPTVDVNPPQEEGAATQPVPATNAQQPPRQ